MPCVCVCVCVRVGGCVCVCVCVFWGGGKIFLRTTEATCGTGPGSCMPFLYVYVYVYVYGPLIPWWMSQVQTPGTHTHPPPPCPPMALASDELAVFALDRLVSGDWKIFKLRLFPKPFYRLSDGFV